METSAATARLMGPAATIAACVVVLAGCGSGSDYANKPRPPSPIIITGVVTPQRVSVSPDKFGAGPATLVISNQTDASQQVTLEDSAGGATSQKTAPINPQETASLKADLERGTYSVRVGDDTIKPAPLTVGPERASAQNELLQP